LINGGASSDTLNVTLDNSTRTQAGIITFNGGSGDDEITINGSQNTFAESYNPNIQIAGEQYDQLAYAKNNSTVNVDINYRNVVKVSDNIETTSLVINNSLNSENLYLSGTSFGAESALTNVDFSSFDKGNITVAANDNSKLLLTDTIEVDGNLTVTASNITQTAGSVNAQGLILDNVTLMGSANDGVEVDVDGLVVQNHSGEIYLNEQGNIDITSISNTSGALNIKALNGAITSSSILTTSGDLDLFAVTNIELLAQNKLTGEVNLSANDNIVLNNDTVTNVEQLSAANAIINSGDSIIITGNTSIVSSSAVQNSSDGVLTLTSTSGDINLSGNTRANTIALDAANDIKKK
jgi:hypothetical protein